jgi:hypothetical protein
VHQSSLTWPVKYHRLKLSTPTRIFPNQWNIYRPQLTKLWGTTSNRPDYSKNNTKHCLKRVTRALSSFGLHSRGLNHGRTTPRAISQVSHIHSQVPTYPGNSWTKSSKNQGLSSFPGAGSIETLIKPSYMVHEAWEAPNSDILMSSKASYSSQCISFDNGDRQARRSHPSICDGMVAAIIRDDVFSTGISSKTLTTHGINVGRVNATVSSVDGNMPTSGQPVHLTTAKRKRRIRDGSDYKRQPLYSRRD